jgi:hypothetical protein
MDRTQVRWLAGENRFPAIGSQPKAILVWIMLLEVRTSSLFHSD